MEELFRLLNDYHPLSPDLLVALMHRFTKEAHRKNKRLLEAGANCDWIAFMEKGLVKVCYEQGDGKERIASFHKERDIIGLVNGYFNRLPCPINIQVIEEVHIRKIRKAELEFICQKYPVFYLHLCKIMDQAYLRMVDHLQVLMEPVRNRFPLVKEKVPWLLEDARVKDYMLADYLGIDKATFSRWKLLKKTGS